MVNATKNQTCLVYTLKKVPTQLSAVSTPAAMHFSSLASHPFVLDNG
jgi:rRNA maturation protein Nop10